MAAYARVLAIPEGAERDADGRGIGDDWLLADLGVDESDGKLVHFYVTTDRIHASELASFRIFQPKRFAEWIVETANNTLEAIIKE